jgi:pimeloyl-ACP methyl ester carboxylesterase
MTVRSQRLKEQPGGFPRPEGTGGIPLTGSSEAIESHRVRVDDVELYCEIAGEGEPLLLIHGLGSCSADWGPQLEYFRRNYRVISFDLRGHGYSSKPHGGYSIERFAKDTAALLDALETGPVHVVGFSLGGMVAFQLAADAPKLVKSMTIVNSGPEVPAETFKQRIPLYVRLLYLHALGMRRMAKMIGKRIFPEPEQADLRRDFIERLAGNEKRCYDASLRAIFAGWGVAERLGDIHCPVLFIVADQDYTPVELRKVYLDRMPNARMVVIPDSRHALPMEKPRELNRAIADFLAPLAGAEGTRSLQEAQTGEVS